MGVYKARVILRDHTDHQIDSRSVSSDNREQLDKDIKAAAIELLGGGLSVGYALRVIWET